MQPDRTCNDGTSYTATILSVVRDDVPNIASDQRDCTN